MNILDNCTRLRCWSYQRAAKVQACAQTHRCLRWSHTLSKYGGKWRLKPKFRHQTLLDTRGCAYIRGICAYAISNKNLVYWPILWPSWSDWWLWNPGGHDRLVVVESWKAQSTGGCGIMEGTIPFTFVSHAHRMSTWLSCSGICPLVVVFLFIYYLFCVTNLNSLRQSIWLWYSSHMLNQLNAMNFRIIINWTNLLPILGLLRSILHFYLRFNRTICKQTEQSK